MKFSVRVEGGREVAQALNGLATRLSRKVQREALYEVAEPMRAAMARHAPHDPGAPDLNKSMTISNATKKDGLDEGAVGVRVGPSKWAFWGLFQEHGTTRHGAQPFMRPAFDTEGPKILQRLVPILWRELAARGVHRPTQTSDAPVVGGPGGGLL